VTDWRGRSGRENDGARYARKESSLEFDRVAFFSDAVFAIAMTLLVVGIGIPEVRESELGDALRGKEAEIISFFISFFVIGFYWMGHHQLFSRLQTVSTRLIRINLAYLAAIAFVPFPTALAGKYTGDPVSIVIYAITLSAASGLEAWMQFVANRDGLFRRTMPPPVLRFVMVASVIPVVVFLASIPIAFYRTTTALWSWILIWPLEIVASKKLKPEGADEYFQ
jgi:uncharacterized membrane protein